MTRISQTYKLEKDLVDKIVALVDSKEMRNKTHVVETALYFYFELLEKDTVTAQNFTEISNKVEKQSIELLELKSDLQLLKASLQTLYDLAQS